jgi:putative transposase
LALSTAEQDYLLGVLDSERFVDTAPATVYATLLDEGHYHGSVRTMYRLLATRNEGWRTTPTAAPPRVHQA